VHAIILLVNLRVFVSLASFLCPVAFPALHGKVLTYQGKNACRILLIIYVKIKKLTLINTGSKYERRGQC